MIRFTALRPHSNRITLGLVILPTDLARIMGGDPEITDLSTLGLESTIGSVGVYFFRDVDEFRKALREAGVDPKMIGMKENVT